MHEPEESAQHQALLDALAKLPPIEPLADQQQRFRARAEAAKVVVSPTRQWIPWAIAAALLLIVGTGWWIDHQHQRNEVTAARTALTTALNDLSAATRLQAVRTAGGSDVRDRGVVESLTQALLTDPSTNVRVAAAQALGRVASPAVFTLAAQKSIAKETSPFVHAALMQATERLDPSTRNTILQLLLARADLDPVVRARAETTLKS